MSSSILIDFEGSCYVNLLHRVRDFRRTGITNDPIMLMFDLNMLLIA